MSGNKTLLIVDDDPQIRQHVSSYLGDNGYTVKMAENARAMDRILASASIDLIILDLNMPGESGLSICRRLAKAPGPAIIMVSAAGEETDRVLGLELGADDYLPKPFSPRELLARVRALLRRREDLRWGGIQRGQLYQFEGFSYDPAKRNLLAPSGATILLTSGEAALLNLMLSKPMTILSRDELNAVDTDGAGRGVDILISRLRKKFESHSGAGILRTQRGAGYGVDCVVTRK